MSLIIAIDQGTTSTRTVAFDHDLNIIHSQQKEYSLKLLLSTNVSIPSPPST